jgi:hypothetical protein
VFFVCMLRVGGRRLVLGARAVDQKTPGDRQGESADESC